MGRSPAGEEASVRVPVGSGERSFIQRIARQAGNRGSGWLTAVMAIAAAVEPERRTGQAARLTARLVHDVSFLPGRGASSVRPQGEVGAKRPNPLLYIAPSIPKWLLQQKRWHVRDFPRDINPRGMRPRQETP